MDFRGRPGFPTHHNWWANPNQNGLTENPRIHKAGFRFRHGGGRCQLSKRDWANNLEEQKSIGTQSGVRLLLRPGRGQGPTCRGPGGGKGFRGMHR